MTKIQIEFHGTPNRDQIKKACKRYLEKEVTKIEVVPIPIRRVGENG